MKEIRILDACCGSRMFWFDKKEPHTTYMDRREEEFEIHKKKINVKPDIVADFRDMPFDDETFNLVVFDPPHLLWAGQKSFMRAQYGQLDLLTWRLDLQQGFEAKAVEFADVLKMGRTQLQDAVPMTVGQEFKAFAVLLEEEVKNLKRTAKLLLEVNLGATAIGTGLNTPEGYPELAVKNLAKVTNLPCVLSDNLIEATSDCGAYVMVHGALKRSAVKLSKVCNDLRLLSSGPRAGLNEINLPELQAGSSIMPAKVNPVVPEVVNQVCFKVIGNDNTITFAAEAGQLQLNVMEPVIGQAMFETISLLSNACVNLRDKCIDGITVNREICQNYVFNSIGIVTYLNPFIGHHNGDIVGKICAQTGKGVREVVLERGLLTEAELDDILSVENLMNPTYKAKRFNEEE